MKFLCEIEVENAAFADGNATDEVGRILSDAVMNGLHLHSAPTQLRDINGNRVGFYCLTNKRLSQ